MKITNLISFTPQEWPFLQILLFKPEILSNLTNFKFAAQMAHSILTDDNFEVKIKVILGISLKKLGKLHSQFFWVLT